MPADGALRLSKKSTDTSRKDTHIFSKFIFEDYRLPRCNTVDITDILQKSDAWLFGSEFLNIGKFPADYTSSHPRD